MREQVPQRFGPFAAPEHPVTQPSKQYGRNLLDRLPSRERKEHAHSSEKNRYIEPEEIIQAMEQNPDTLEQTLKEASPEFLFDMRSARWNNELFSFFKTCAEADKNSDLPVDALWVRRSFLQNGKEAENALSGVVAELHAMQLLTTLENAEVARAHYALDAGAGMDFFLYVPDKEKTANGAYFAVQIKTDPVYLVPHMKHADEALNTETNVKTKKGLEASVKGCAEISKRTGNRYTPLILYMPSYKKLVEDELVDHRTLALSPTKTIDRWRDIVVSFFQKQNKKQEK